MSEKIVLDRSVVEKGLNTVIALVTLLEGYAKSTLVIKNNDNHSLDKLSVSIEGIKQFATERLEDNNDNSPSGPKRP
jgi:hypothetical protein